MVVCVTLGMNACTVCGAVLHHERESGCWLCSSASAALPLAHPIIVLQAAWIKSTLLYLQCVLFCVLSLKYRLINLPAPALSTSLLACPAKCRRLGDQGSSDPSPEP